MIETTLGVPYDSFLKLKTDPARHFPELRQGFERFEADMAARFRGRGRPLRVFIHGGNESGCVCLSFLRKMEGVEVAGVIDRFEPNGCFSGVPHHVHLDGGGDLPDLVIVATAPRHYPVIRETYAGDGLVQIVFLYDESGAQAFPDKPVDETDRAFLRISELCSKLRVEESIALFYKKMAAGAWRNYERDLLSHIRFGFEGRTVLDYGCGSAGLLPLLARRGTGHYLGVEHRATRVESLRRLFKGVHDNGDFLLSIEGLVPISPDSVDLVIINEVITHINPCFLDTVFSEIHRVLRPGGLLFVSDGNNLDCSGMREEVLRPLYDAMELADPAGGGVRVVDEHGLDLKPYVVQRYEMIKSWHPSLPDEELAYLARNTFRLTDAMLRREVDGYVVTGRLAERPYRKGVCPVSPAEGAVLPERGVYPDMILLHLREFGFHCRHVYERAELRAQKNFAIEAIKVLPDL